MDAGHPFFRHNGPVLRGGVHTVGGNAAVVPHPVLVQRLDGGEAVAVQAGLVLAAGLGHMHMHPLVVVVGKLGHPLPQGGGRGVLSVDGGV